MSVIHSKCKSHSGQHWTNSFRRNVFSKFHAMLRPTHVSIMYAGVIQISIAYAGVIKFQDRKQNKWSSRGNQYWATIIQAVLKVKILWSFQFNIISVKHYKPIIYNEGHDLAIINYKIMVLVTLVVTCGSTILDLLMGEVSD